MRLDHLLSRERTEGEIRKFIPGRYKQKAEASKFVELERAKAEEAKNPRSEKLSGRMTVLLLEPVSFSGIAKRSERKQAELRKPDLYFENCTARWKTSCKETSCEAMM